MKNIDLSTVPDQQEFQRLTKGGYICKITSVEDVPEKEYLIIEYDIAHGEFKGYYQQLFDNKKFWGGKFTRSYKESALSFFKGFITAVERSNPNYAWNSKEVSLMGKYVGLVLADEEYSKKDGTIGTRLYVAQVRSVDEIKQGNFKVPDLKPLRNKSIMDGLGSKQGVDEEINF